MQKSIKNSRERKWCIHTADSCLSMFLLNGKDKAWRETVSPCYMLVTCAYVQCPAPSASCQLPWRSAAAGGALTPLWACILTPATPASASSSPGLCWSRWDLLRCNNNVRCLQYRWAATLSQIPRREKLKWSPTSSQDGESLSYLNLFATRASPVLSFKSPNLFCINSPLRQNQHSLSVFLLTLYLVRYFEKEVKYKNLNFFFQRREKASFILSPAVHFSKIIFLGNKFSKDWKPSFKLNSKYSSLIKFEFLWVASNSVVSRRVI